MSTDFDALLTQNIQSIRRIARSYANSGDSEDLVQDILFQLWRSHRNFRGDAKPETWVYRVAINTAVTHQRREIRNRHGQQKNRELELSGQSLFGLSQDEILQAFLRGLNDVDIAVLTMYLDGLTASAMEEVLGIRANAIEVRISRLKNKFKKIFVD